ncbi:iron uptake porin [Leptolyngbya sp. Cla-17]|uniref:iron uptake porin n=1 Tax=Leptolyngbya sp. Cla-17 TaxID=2803751 RepID=UPI001F5C8872|nr:iron uptake porin [Leptolyngbya sp. Cla-17]
MQQITSVSQLSDVQPTDWAYGALQSLVERYGCIVGYPDLPFKGNRALTRYEFAAGFNACLDKIQELLAASTVDLAKREDLEPIKRLIEEFTPELALLRGTVEALEVRTATLEKQQFSTTTKLFGEVIFALTDEFRQNSRNQPVFQNRVRLNLETSFVGKDVLHVRLAAANTQRFVTPDNTAEGTQQFNIRGNTRNSVQVDWLSYLFPVGDRLHGYVAATGGIHSDYVWSTFNPYLEDYDGGNGALSAFGQESPIYRIGGGAGGGLTYQLGKTLAISAGYLAGPDAFSPAQKNGIFDGNYAALGQLTISPSDQFQLGLTYVHSYNSGETPLFNLGTTQAFTGTALANRFFGNRAISTNSYGAQASLKITPGFAISGFFGYTGVIPEGGSIVNLRRKKQDVWYYGGNLAFPDLFKKGNLGGLVFGAEPYLGSSSRSIPSDRSWHIEAFYRYQVNDYISITPGLIWITAPNQSDRNDDIVLGTVRVTFRF